MHHDEIDHDEHRAVDAIIAEEREAEITPMMCAWCRKRPIPAGRFESCSPECFRRLQKSDRALAKLDRQAPRENLGGIGS